MSDKRQKNQLVLAFTEEGRSEAPKASQEGTESFTAKCGTERPASHEQLMEEVCERENCWQAYKRVKANKGSPGIDGMKVQQGLRRNTPFGLRVAAEAESQKLPLFRSGHCALRLVHLELQSTCEKTSDIRHHPLSRPLAADIDVAVIRISHEAMFTSRNPLNRRTRTRIYGGVAGESGRPLPLCRFRKSVQTLC